MFCKMPISQFTVFKVHPRQIVSDGSVMEQFAQQQAGGDASPAGRGLQSSSILLYPEVHAGALVQQLDRPTLAGSTATGSVPAPECRAIPALRQGMHRLIPARRRCSPCRNMIL